ncbi:hypothetical protein HKK80_05240 [Halonotius sp. F2-221B]|uniref:hypothetical protein n=1 Tax=Halonotius sp. F2-221B TaxID=2731620 RepID=UPI00398BB4DB
MPSTDDDTVLDPETEAAIRRVVREELDQHDATDSRGAVRAITQIGGGLLVGWFGLAAVTGGLVALDAPLGAFGLVAVGVLLLIAYGWRLPPFR